MQMTLQHSKQVRDGFVESLLISFAFYYIAVRELEITDPK